LAFITYGIQELVGNVEVENTASIKVLEKLGLQCVADEAGSEKALKYKLDFKNYNLKK
jgi:RimJ/RimL family protein N-acetyltransferase